MKRLIYVAVIIATFSSCQADPESHLERAKDHLNEQAYIAYHHSALWPNMIGEIDTISGITKLQKNKNKYFQYDFIGLREQKSDLVYIQDNFKQINHEDKVVWNYSPEDLQKDSMIVYENILIENSPVVLLKKEEWMYVTDTLIRNSRLSNFYFTESDTIIDGKRVTVEKHIFINTTSKLLERYERRAFLDGKENQFVIFTYSDYELKKDPIDFKYELPEIYISKVAGDKETIIPLEEGMESPDFIASDMEGNFIQLSSLRGKKVLLNFSIINCGWCKVAIDHFNQNDYHLKDNILVYYINPVDSKIQMEKYIQKFQVSFPVIPEAKDLGKSFMVNGYPTFYLIDEEGKIENVSVGYRKDFIDNLAIH